MLYLQWAAQTLAVNLKRFGRIKSTE